MKKEAFILAVLVGLFLATSPIASQAVDKIHELVPAESQAVDTCGPQFVAAPTSDYMAVAESQEVDRTGPRFVAAPTNDYMAVAESQEVDRTGASWAAEKTPELVECASCPDRVACASCIACR